MRRKNWLNKKKHLSGNPYLYDFLLKNNAKNIDKHHSAEYLFKVFFFKNKVIYLNTNLNIYFFKYFLYFFKYFKKTSMLRNFYKIYRNDDSILSPSFTFPSQYFEYRSIFFTVLKKNNLKGFFIYKNLFNHSNYKMDYFSNKHLCVGYNFFIINSNFKIFEKLNNIFMDKEYNKIGKNKFFFNYKLIYNFNYFINYNIYMLSILEIYKININLFFLILLKNQKNN